MRIFLVSFALVNMIFLHFAYAKTEEELFAHPWILHYRYTETYKQRARLMTLFFFRDGTCSSTGKSTCDWTFTNGRMKIWFTSIKNGETIPGNSFESNFESENRFLGQFKKPDGALAGDWLMVSDHHPVYFESRSYTSIWDNWILHFKLNLKEESPFEEKPIRMMSNAQCQVGDAQADCAWQQFAEAASFWINVEGKRFHFQTNTGPTDKSPSGFVVTEANEILGLWFLSPK